MPWYNPFTWYEELYGVGLKEFAPEYGGSVPVPEISPEELEYRYPGRYDYEYEQVLEAIRKAARAAGEPAKEAAISIGALVVLAAVVMYFATRD